eukprot:TRINITY_DN19209_c0_g1_i1.p1 TRINITY_DN19209_c0_g1~~TRINITY_DN19209_c0_g1_i1.p1  ORF type:complete len:169 (-),score=7.11 TRINITY_DN19209_c0_g1_i1:15-521(-)
MAVVKRKPSRAAGLRCAQHGSKSVQKRVAHARKAAVVAPLRAVEAVDAWHSAVWRAVQSIPRGRLSTYGDIARALGSPDHSRHVGTALASLPSGNFEGRGQVPWWRVVNSSGRISFRPNDVTESGSGSHQQNRLAKEGIRFSKSSGLGCAILRFAELRWNFSVDSAGS